MGVGRWGGGGGRIKCPLYNLASRHKINKFHKKKRDLMRHAKVQSN